MKVYCVYAEGSSYSSGETLGYCHILKAFFSLEKANNYKEEIQKDYSCNPRKYEFRYDFFDVEEVELDES